MTDIATQVSQRYEDLFRVGDNVIAGYEGGWQHLPVPLCLPFRISPVSLYR